MTSPSAAARPSVSLAQVRSRLPDGTPDPVRDTVADFCLGLGEAFGDDLTALVLFGSAAEGRLRTTSDVNMLVVLRSFSAQHAQRLADTARMAFTAVRLRAMYVLENEVADAAEAFAVKFEDIQARHVVLYGEDFVARIEIPRAAIVRRLEEVLLNTTLRLRASCSLHAGRSEALAREVADVAGPLRSAALALVALEGQSSESPRAALVKVCARLPGDWSATLAQLTATRAGSHLDAAAALALAIRMTELASAMRALLPRMGS